MFGYQEEGVSQVQTEDLEADLDDEQSKSTKKGKKKKKKKAGDEDQDTEIREDPEVAERRRVMELR